MRRWCCRPEIMPHLYCSSCSNLPALLQALDLRRILAVEPMPGHDQPSRVPRGASPTTSPQLAQVLPFCRGRRSPHRLHFHVDFHRCDLSSQILFLLAAFRPRAPLNDDQRSFRVGAIHIFHRPRNMGQMRRNEAKITCCCIDSDSDTNRFSE